MPVFNTNPTLAIGISGFADFSTDLPFLDLMKQARPFWAYADGQWESMTHAALVSGNHLDANLWPTEIPEGMAGIRTIWALPEGVSLGSGNYVLTYEGAGTLSLGDVPGWDITLSEPGRIEFSRVGPFWLNITVTDPSALGNYLKSIRIVPAEYEALADAGEIFNPDFLAIVQDMRQLRFMDWMQTNFSTQSEWADRPQVADAMWTQAGVPLEIMVALANKVGADPWFNMPHMATDEYIENFAEYVRDNLDSGLVANVEYSNETWNFSFSGASGQYTWLAAQAQAEWGVTGGDGWVQYSAKRATEAAMIWDEAFGAEADARVYNVIGVHRGWQALAEAQINAALWEDEEPENFVDPSSVFDAIAITCYFGGEHVVNETLRGELLAQIEAHPTDPETVYDWLTDRLLNRTDIYGSLPDIEGIFASFRALADSLGMDLVAYEGGSHEHHSAFIDVPQEDLDKLTSFYVVYSYSPQIAEVHEAVWDAWAEVSDGPFMQFGTVGTPGPSGSWSMLRTLDDSNAKADMLNALNATSTPWGGMTGGERYLHEVADQLEDGETAEFTTRGGLLIGGGYNALSTDTPLSEFTVTKDEDGTLHVGDLELRSGRWAIAFPAAA